MVIQIIPKQPEGRSILANILLFVSVALVISATTSYFILDNSLKKTEEKIVSLDKKLALENSSERVALEKEVSTYQKKINDFSTLLSGHIYSSQLFPFLENLTHPKVAFSDFSADMDKKNITLSGVTDSFLTLGQQLIIFKAEKLILSVQLSNIAFEKDGKISFDFNLALDPQIFKNNQ
jgi:hypothetical protein